MKRRNLSLVSLRDRGSKRDEHADRMFSGKREEIHVRFSVLKLGTSLSLIFDRPECVQASCRKSSLRDRVCHELHVSVDNGSIVCSASHGFHRVRERASLFLIQFPCDSFGDLEDSCTCPCFPPTISPLVWQPTFRWTLRQSSAAHITPDTRADGRVRLRRR